VDTTAAPDRVVVRRAAGVAVAACVALFAVRVVALFEGDRTDAWRLAAALAVAGIVALAVLLAVVAVRVGLRLAGRIDRVRPTAPAAIVAAAVGLAAAAPVHTAWDDGCNAHDANVPMLALPYVDVATPTTAPAYDETVTLVLCRRVDPEPATP
jgi:hypothetical protein